MSEMFLWFLACIFAYLASVLSGVVGFGGAMIFLPFLVAIYGVKASVPILTVAVLLGNASRVYFNKRELNLKLVLLFLLPMLPARNPGKSRKMRRAAVGYPAFGHCAYFLFPLHLS